MLTKTNFEIAKIADIKSGNLLINNKYTVANDGRRLIEVSRPIVNPDSMLYIDGFVETRKTKDIIMDRKTSLSIAKKITAENKTDTIQVRTARISNNVVLKVATMDKKLNSEVSTVMQGVGCYPKYKEVIPKNDDAIVTIAINPEYLKDICDIMAKFQTDKNKRAYMHIYDNSIKIRTYNKNTRQKCQAVIMNMSIDSTEAGLKSDEKMVIEETCDKINVARNKCQGDPGYVFTQYTLSTNITIVRVLPEDEKMLSGIIFKSNEFKKAKKYLDDILAIVIN